MDAVLAARSACDLPVNRVERTSTFEVPETHQG